ncbi:hypothetical protein QQ045_021858 [Rhodiola kirilowii]
MSPMQVRDADCHPEPSTVPYEQTQTQPNTRMKDTKRSKVKFLPESEAAVLPNNARSGLLPVPNFVRKSYPHPRRNNSPALRIGSPVKPSAPVRDFCQLTKDRRENRELKGMGKKIAVTEKPSTSVAPSSIQGNCHGSYEKENEEHEQESMDKVQPKERAIFEIFTKNPVDTDAIWSGQIEILNYPDHGLISGLQAFTPCLVHRKAYFFSSNLPSSLSLNIISRNVLWDERFKDFTPNEDDVALYILPGNLDRCSHSQPYNYLMETLDSHDYALHGYINGVELIVFTSRWLEVDCKEPESQNFLWGVYRCVLPEYVTTNKESNTAKVLVGEDVDADVSMEVDMIDGEWIGHEETIVTKETKPSCLEQTQVNPLYQTGKSVNEEHLVFPPGFEQQYQLKKSMH